MKYYTGPDGKRYAKMETAADDIPAAMYNSRVCLEGRSPEPTPELRHCMGAAEMQRTAEVMQEAARDFMNAADKLKTSFEVLENIVSKFHTAVMELDLIMIRLERLK